jgi:hypothetical protein
MRETTVLLAMKSDFGTEGLHGRNAHAAASRT